MHGIISKTILCLAMCLLLVGCYDRNPQVAITGELHKTDRQQVLTELSELAAGLGYEEYRALYEEFERMYPDENIRAFRHSSYDAGMLSVSLSKSDRTFKIVFADLGSWSDFTPEGKALAEKGLERVREYFPPEAIKKVRKVGW